MKAVTWHGRRDVRVDTMPAPILLDPTDGAVSNGFVGNAAPDAFKLGGKSLRLRFAWGRQQEQKLFASYTVCPVIGVFGVGVQ